MLNLMLDSGAYSAWKSGTVIDIREYAEFIAELGAVDSVVNLDVIPGGFGQAPSAEQVEQSARQSWENYETLRFLGIEAIPVFHQGEEWHWLERMVDAGVPYIGISPANDKMVAQRLTWLDEAFTRITNEDGWPVVKTHGFGLTSISLMNRYPWYSCDSITWIKNAAYGILMVPLCDSSGCWDYCLAPQPMSISNRYAHMMAKDIHYMQLGPGSQEYVRRYVEEEVGISFADAQNDYKARIHCNLTFFLKYEKNRIGCQFRYPTSSSLFASRRNGQPGLPMKKMRLIKAENFSRGHSAILYKNGVKDRLLSYGIIKSVGWKSVYEYLQSDGRLIKGEPVNGY